jgi:hypothetical protein
VGGHRARCTRLPHAGAHRRRGSASHSRGAGAVRRRCPQGHHCGRREAADCRDKGDSRLRQSSQEGRSRRPTCCPSGSTRRPRAANRNTEDERARCSSSPGAVASARAPAHARRRKSIESRATASSGRDPHTQTLTRSRQLLSERVATPVLLAEVLSPAHALGGALLGHVCDARRDEPRGVADAIDAVRRHDRGVEPAFPA